LKLCGPLTPVDADTISVLGLSSNLLELGVEGGEFG